LLLLLDNFEHLIAAASDLTPLLGNCPNLSLVVTSRELLQLAPEQSYPVPPLDPPDGVQLFVARAKAVKPAFKPDDALPALCERLDNLPLALELAAARVRILSPQQLHERLTQRLDLLKAGRDADPRQQTLRATIEWSYDLLDEDEQRLFARLAIFRGGCALEAAEQVADADVDTLQSLVDKSLVRHTGERFWMLETIRAYAREQLAASGEEPELRRCHALCALELGEAARREMEEGGDQTIGLARIETEHDNLRAALEWARDSRADEVLLRLVAALASFWPGRGYYRECDLWFPLALERGPSLAEARMKVLRAASLRAAGRGDYRLSDAYILEWRSLAEQAGDEGQVLLAMNSAALNSSEQGDLKTARAELIAIGGRAREIGDLMMVAFSAINLGMVARQAGDIQAALEYSNRAVELFRELGDDGGVATALGSCGWSSLELSDPDHAEASFREALTLACGLAWKRGVAVNAAGLGAALVAAGKAERAAQLFGAAAAIHEELGIFFDDALEEQVHERAVAAAKAALGDDAFDDAWVRGEAMTPEEIVAFAEPGQSVRSPS
jgi:non-specific serine/threonine protein kinase